MKVIVIRFILSVLDVITSNYHWNYVDGNRGFLQHRLICDYLNKFDLNENFTLKYKNSTQFSNLCYQIKWNQKKPSHIKSIKIWNQTKSNKLETPSEMSVISFNFVRAVWWCLSCNIDGYDFDCLLNVKMPCFLLIYKWIYPAWLQGKTTNLSKI